MDINELKFKVCYGIRNDKDLNRVDKMIENVKSIRSLTIEGMIYDCTDIAKSILDRIKSKGVEVENVNVVIDM